MSAPKVCECCGRPLPNVYLEAVAGAGLTAQERELFLAVADGAAEIVTYQSIIDRLWGDEVDGGPLGVERVVFTVVCRLNRKMAKRGYRLSNVRSIGYRLTSLNVEVSA